MPEVGRNTAVAKLIKEYVEQEDARLDKQIHIEPDAMTAQLEGKHADVMVKLAALEVDRVRPPRCRPFHRLRS